MIRRLIGCLIVICFVGVVVGCNDKPPAATTPTQTPVPGPRGDGKNKKFGPVDEVKLPPKSK